MKLSWSAAAVAAILVGSSYFGVATAATVFSDDFNGAPNAAWGNEAGSWVSTGGVYDAQSPSNLPNGRSLVSSLTLTDFAVTVTINNANDGGVWLRASDVAGLIGAEGVLLVTRDSLLYWHVVADDSYGAALATATVTPISYELRVIAQGNQYSAYVNDVLITTIIDNTYTSGLTGLYDFSSLQTFDDFRVEAEVPLPAALPLFASTLLGGGIIAWRRKRKSRTAVVAAYSPALSAARSSRGGSGEPGMIFRRRCSSHGSASRESQRVRTTVAGSADHQLRSKVDTVPLPPCSSRPAQSR